MEDDMATLRKTADSVCDISLQDILGAEELPTEAVIAVCAGEWRRNADGSYTFWELEDE